MFIVSLDLRNDSPQWIKTVLALFLQRADAKLF